MRKKRAESRIDLCDSLSRGSEIEDETWPAISALLKDDSNLFYGYFPWDYNLQERCSPMEYQLLHIPIHFRLKSLVTHILENWKVSVNSNNDDIFDGLTVLMRAASESTLPIVKLLLDKGAYIEAEDRYGQTALSQAAARGCKDMVKLLLDRGANMNCENDDDQTPLSLALKLGHESIVTLLKNRGCTISENVRRVSAKQID
jgi:hypothetical protein